MFAEFEEKIQCRLVHYMKVKDLKALSLVNHEHNKSVKKYLFHTVRIPTVDVQVRSLLYISTVIVLGLCPKYDQTFNFIGC